MKYTEDSLINHLSDPIEIEPVVKKIKTIKSLNKLCGNDIKEVLLNIDTVKDLFIHGYHGSQEDIELFNTENGDYQFKTSFKEIHDHVFDIDYYYLHYLNIMYNCEYWDSIQ